MLYKGLPTKVFYRVTHKSILQGYPQRYSTRSTTKVFYKVTPYKGILQDYPQMYSTVLPTKVFYRVTHKGILQGQLQRYSTGLPTKIFYRVTHKGITDSIKMLRIKLEDLLLFLVLIRLAPGFSFHPSRILSFHLLRILYSTQINCSKLLCSWSF